MRRGVTLLEILVVLVILSILLGLTVVLVKNSGRDLGVQSSANAVAGLLRQSSTHARIESTPLWVVVDSQDRSVRAVTRHVLGNWHFEAAAGATDLGGWSSDGARPAVGKLGRGIFLNGASSASFGGIGPLDAQQGFFIEMWIRRARVSSSRQRLVTFGEKEGIDVDGRGLVTARFGGLSITAARPAAVETWVHLMVVYDPEGELKVYLNGDPAGAVNGRAVIPSRISCAVGARKEGFVGDVDEVIIGLIVQRDRVLLGGDTRITQPDGTALTQPVMRIHFGPDGGLDPRLHPGPVRFSVRNDTESRTVTVLLNGSVLRE